MSFYKNNFKGKLQYLNESEGFDKELLEEMDMDASGLYGLRQQVNQKGESAASDLVDDYISELSGGIDPKSFGTSDKHTQGILLVAHLINMGNLKKADEVAKKVARLVINMNKYDKKSENSATM